MSRSVGRVVLCTFAVTIVPLGAQAQDADDGEIFRMEEIVVSGERVERTVADTPSSVSVFTDETLEKTPSVESTEELLQRVPNVTSIGTQNEAPTIRGVDTTGVLSDADAFFGGSRPRATIAVDGRPLSFNEYVFGATSLFDLRRVEVFRGPQTTAQGANSIAGAIYLVTEDPTFEPEFKALGQGGNFGRLQLGAAASGPIIEDELAGRITVEYRERNSFVDFQRTADFADPDEFEASTVRTKLLWEPAAVPELSTKLTFSRTANQAPQTEFVAAPFEDLVALNPNQSVFENVAYAGIHDISYALGEDVEIANRFSATGFTNERLSEPGQGVAEVDGLDVVNETTLNYTALDGRLTGLFGTYLQFKDQDESIDLTAFLGNGVFDDRSTSVGVFGEATYAITPRLDATLGLRYQRDRQDRDGTIGPFVVDFDETFDAVLPKVALGYDITKDLRVGALVSRGFNPGGTTLFFSTGEQDTFDEETVWNGEVFARAGFLDDRLTVNANAFYAAFRDFQRFTFTGFDPLGDPEFQIDNADRARSYGLELNVDIEVAEELSAFVGLGLLGTEIVEFPASADPGVEGTEFARAPNVTLSAGADYELLDGLSLGTRVRYSDGYFSDAGNTDAFAIDSYVVADFHLSYQYRNVEAFAFVNNAFDNFYLLTRLENSAVVGTPREFGAGLRVAF